MRNVQLVTVAALAASACLPADDLELGRTVQAQVAEPTQCDDDGCGAGNSPVIDGVYFWNLNSDEEPNDRGVSISKVLRNDNKVMRLIAVGDRLRGVDPISGVTLAEGAGLVGTRILVSVNRAPHAITISYVSTPAEAETFWIEPYHKVETYKFRFAPVGEMTSRPLCSLASDGPDDQMIRAIVFTGDRYNPVTKEITLGAVTSGWINFACKDSAPYKMHLSGHTTVAGMRLGLVTSLAKRRAMLNAWTMNACGTGKAFTVSGTRITLFESQHLVGQWPSPFHDNPATLESIWSATRALCMNVHRLALDPIYPAIQLDMARECARLPPCSTILGDKDWTDFDEFGYVVTGTPPPPP